MTPDTPTPMTAIDVPAPHLEEVRRGHRSMLMKGGRRDYPLGPVALQADSPADGEEAVVVDVVCVAYCRLNSILSTDGDEGELLAARERLTAFSEITIVGFTYDAALPQA